MRTLPDTMASLPDRFRPKEAGNLRSGIQFRFSGEGGGAWFMVISEGRCHIQEGELVDPDAVIMMEAADFIGINDGSVNAVETFWSGRIIVEGDIEAVLALPPVMDWR